MKVGKWHKFRRRLQVFRYIILVMIKDTLVNIKAFMYYFLVIKTHIILSRYL